VKNTIIFDLDGTLVDSARVCTHILNTMLLDRGSDRQITVEETKPHLSRGGTAMVAALLGEQCGDEVEAISEFRARYAQLPTSQDSLFEGVRTGLQWLATQNVRLAICSNKPQNLCDKVLNDLDLAGLFHVVVGSGHGRRSKPDPQLLDFTLARLGARANDCFFVGDSEVDQATAAHHNMAFLFLTHGYASAGWSGEGVECFDHFSDLVDSLRSRVMGHQHLSRVA
jgi:phosphoglycolate phosphatase